MAEITLAMWTTYSWFCSFIAACFKNLFEKMLLLISFSIIFTPSHIGNFVS